MKTILLKGGLGNQLYQIAAINSYCKDNDEEFFIDFSARFGCGQGKHPVMYKDNFYKNFKTGKITDDFKLLQEPKFTYNKIEKTDENVVYEGYYQSPKYFAKYRDELNDWFCFDEEKYSPIENKINQLREKTGKKVVGVHVRRGDYTHNPDIHPSIPKSFYDKAKNMFKDHVFIYATDDFATVSKEFKFDDNNIYVNGESELEDFYTLSCCDSIIMGNSTFAAWSSYLGKKKEKVIAPVPWFGPKGPEYKDLLDDNWTIIKA